MNYFEKRYNKKDVLNEKAKYDFWRYGNNLGQRLDDIEVEYALEFIIKKLKENSVKKINIFDIGCGTGYHLINIFKALKNENLNEINCIGVDTNENYINQARANVKNEMTLTEDICRFNFVSVDVTEINSIHQIEDVDNILNVYMFLGVVQYLDDHQINIFLELIPKKTTNSILIKHPLNYSNEEIFEKEREGYTYNSRYKNFIEIYTPFSNHFDFIKMEKCYRLSDFNTRKEYDDANSKENTKLVFIILENYEDAILKTRKAQNLLYEKYDINKIAKKICNTN